MCGRFAFYSPHEAVVRLFGVADFAPDVEPRYNIAPTTYIPAVRVLPGDPVQAVIRFFETGNRVFQSFLRDVLFRFEYQILYPTRRVFVTNGDARGAEILHQSVEQCHDLFAVIDDPDGS